MRCHEVGYRIIGHDMQMVEVELDPGETVIAEAGHQNRHQLQPQTQQQPPAGLRSCT